MSVKISALSAGTTLAGTEAIPMVQGATAATVKTTPNAIVAWTITTLAGESSTTPVSTDVVSIFRSGTPYAVALSTITTLVASSTLWSGLTSGSAVVTGDLLAVDRSGLKKVTVDAMATFTVSAIAAGSGQAPVTTDTFPFFHSGAQHIATIDQITTYATTNGILAVGASATIATTDYLLGIISAAGKKITLANLEAQIKSDLTQGVLNATASLSAAGSLNTADKYLLTQSGTAVYAALSTIETKVFADFVTYAAALTNIGTLAAGDQFYAVHSSTTPKSVLASDVATFTTAALWSGATAEAAGPVTGDLMLMYRSAVGTITCTVDTLATYFATGAQAGILNLSTLSVTTSPSTAGLMLIYQSSTAYACTLANIAAACWTASIVAIQALSAKTAPVPADQVLLLDSAASSAPKLATISAVKLAAVYTTACAATASGYTALPTTSDWVEIQGVTGQTAWGWKLGAAGTVGQKITLIETAGFNGVLAPFTSGTINGLATNATVTITAHHVYECRCVAANAWVVNDSGAQPQS